MDYIRFKSRCHFIKLMCLCNVASGKGNVVEGEGTAEIMGAPATTDILMEFPYVPPAAEAPDTCAVSYPDCTRYGYAERGQRGQTDAL